ncbi:MAG: hypothetical protein M3Y60_13560 [Bacteroidota bacterium]|nr:hypothetical protein [Bacteroidota bacterium]
MKTSNIRKAFAIALLLTIASPVMSADRTDPKIAIENTESRAVQLQTRLEEIRSMDKEELSRAEKKNLRHEVREIKKELAAISGGVYLSIGAIILVALLLILLL